MNADDTVTLRSGNRMPPLGLGTWQLTRDTAGTVAAALRAGYRMIDTSGDYGTQPGIAEGIESSGVDRSNLYLVTKVEETDEPYAATKRNLRELGTDYADLMLLHRPPDDGAGEQLWRGLMQARSDGLARDIGVSNYSAELIDQLAQATGEVPAVNQIEWSPLGHSDAMQDYAQRHKMVIQAYSPLTRATRLDDEALVAIADRYGKTPAQILIRWNLQRGTVPLPKANTKSHLNENLEVFDFEIADADMADLDALNQHYSSLGALPYV